MLKLLLKLEMYLRFFLFFFASVGVISVFVHILTHLNVTNVPVETTRGRRRPQAVCNYLLCQ